MKQTKIDWCDCTINPVVGCTNGCPYCYARKINDRFHFVENWDNPQFFPERLEQLSSQSPKSIFMDSMSDVGLWKMEWIDEVTKAIQKNKQHNYIFLSKCFNGFVGNQKEHGIENSWFGFSLTKQSQIETLNRTWFDFLSVEPLLEHLDFTELRKRRIQLVIIGAETGNRKGKVVPQKQWVLDIVKWCDDKGVAVFMKESLRKIMGDDFRQDMLPWAIKG